MKKRYELRKRSGLVLLLGWLALLLVADPSAAQEALGSRQNAQLTLLHLADVYQMSPVDGGKAGGLARVATLKKELAATKRNVLVTLSGDFLSPSVASSVFQGAQMVEGLAQMGLDLATLGNHELDFGSALLRTRMQQASWQWVLTNVLDSATGEPLEGAPAYLVREFEDLKVGFFGLCLSGDEINQKNREGVTFLEPLDAAERVLAILEREQVDVIVALTHLNFVDDVRLAQRFPEINLILGGHEHFPVTTQIGKTLITKPGSDTRHVARIDISRPRPDAAVELHFELIPITESLAEDPATAAVVAKWEARLDNELQVVVGSTREPLNAVAEIVRSRESNLGNLMADAMRRDTGADIAILNGGSIRSNRIYPAGELTRRDLVAMHPFGGITCTVEVSGAVVLKALNHGTGRLGESTGRFPQVSGVRFLIDPEQPAGDRVVDVVVGEEPLDLKRSYRVAVGDYMLGGGDGYSMFGDGKVLVSPQEGNMLVVGLEIFVSEHSPVAPQVEGRIRFPDKAAPATASRGVILDTDMGIDSVMGLLYLLKSPAVDVRAITIVHGIADVKPGANNAVRVLELTGDTEIPVARGNRHPLVGKRSFPSFWKPQANTLGGARLPRAAIKPRRNAAELIIETLETSADPLTVVAMGPLTNIAEALDANPQIVHKIAEIVVMGGALTVNGNVGTPFVGIDNNAAEWNFYLDPHAAARVLQSGARIRLMPLESTQALPVTPEFVNRLRSQPRDQTSELLLALLEAVNEGIEAGWYYFWDVLAAVATARSDVLACREEHIEVVTADGPNFGQTRIVADGARVCVGEDINRQAFEDDFLKVVLD